MSKKKVKQGLSLVMSLLLCVTSANFSMLASAAEADAARIIGFNQLDESIASQNLPVGASIDDVIFPESINATVETVEEIEVKKLIEKEKPDEAEDEEVVSTAEDDTDVETEDKAAEPGEKAEETTTDETIVEEEPTEPEAEQPEEIPAEETTESEPDAPEDTDGDESVDTGLIDILFPAMIAHAAEQEEEPALVSGAMAVSTEPEYETVVEKKVVYSEITISDVKWEIENGTKFDSSKEASFVFKPVFNTDYTVNVETPTIKVNIVNTDTKTAFEKSQVVDGVRVNVKADAGVFPEGATLSVAKVSGQELQAVEEAVDEARADAKNKVESYTFDIKVLDKDGNEIEPDNSKGQVKVSFTLEEVADVNLDTDVYHVKGEVGDLSVDKLDAEEVAATTVEAVTDGFSFYTVEFTYNNLQYVMNGDTTVALSEILSAVGLEGEVSAATSDAPELFSVSKEDGVWYVTANQAFDTEQKLTVSIGGNDYVIVVTDDVTYLWVGGVPVTEANKDCIAGTTDAPTARFNSEQSILYLNDFSSSSLSSSSNYLKAVISSNLSHLTINLSGTNCLSPSTDYCVAQLSGKLTITGEGSLALNGGSNGIYCQSSYLEINGGTITNSDEQYGVSSTNSSTVITNPAIAINGGDITLSGTQAAMSILGATVINGGTVNLNSDAMDGTSGAKIVLGAGVKAYQSADNTTWTEVTSETGYFTVGQFYSGYAKFGPETYDLWVGGTQVTSANKNNITGNSTQVPEAKYDSDTNTLYLTDFNASYDSPSWDKKAIIYNGMNNLTINLTGTNNLSLTGTADNYHCIRSSTALNIEGTGSLHLNGGETGIYCSGQLSIEDVSITNENEQYGIDSRHSGGLVSAPPIRFDGANINLSGTVNSIYTLGSVIVVNSGTVILGKPALANNVNKKVVLGDGIKAYAKDNIVDDWDEVSKTDDGYKFSAFDGKYVRFGPEPYDLWVGGVQVTEANASNIDGNSKASYDVENNILTLNGYTYEGTGYYDDSLSEAVIFYNGDTDLTIDFKGNNTLKLDKSSNSSRKYVIYGEKGFIFKSSDNTGTLKLSFDNTTTFKDSCMAMYSYSGAIRFTSGTVYATGGNTTSSHSSGVVSDAVYIDGGTVYATGGDLTVPNGDDSNLYSFGIEQAGASLGTLTISKGKLQAKGGGLVKPEGSSDAYYFASVGVSANIELGNADFRSVGDTCALQLLKNSIAGKGGVDLGNLTEVINVSDNSRNLTYKAVDFTAKSVPAPLSRSEAFDAIGVDFENETVSPVIGYEVSSSNESYVPVTSLTELLDSDNPAIYVRIAETDTALASPWTEIAWPRPAAPSGIEGGAEEIIGTTTDMEYTKVGESTYTTASNTTTAVRAGEYLIRLKAGILNFASKPVKVVVYANEPVQETKDPQNPPTADQFTVTNAMPGKSDGAISGVTKAMEYSADNGVTWTLIKANPLTGLAAGTYLIRYAETAEKEASDSIAIKVDEKETGTISILVKPDNPEEQRSFEIRVEKGNSIVATRYFGKISEAGSTVTFEDLEVGIYNIICLSTNEEFAETKLLTVEKGKVTDIAFTVLPGEIKTLVTVGEDAPAVAVDGLSSLLTPEEKEAAANGDKAITVELTAEKAPETATGVEDIKNIMTPGQTIDTVLDLSLIKITKDLNTNEETKNDIGKDNDKVLEIAIPYDVADGKEISIFRYHEDANGGKTTKQFSSLSGRLLAGLYEDAKFFFDRIKKYIYLYASDFSTYAIAISDSSETAAVATSSESGSNSSSGIKTVPVYRLFNPTKGYHFYTADAAEKDALVAAGWNDEGIAWQAGEKDGKPVYRLFDVNGNGGHFFTTSEEEKAGYIAKGYRDEGIAWFAPSYAGRKVYKITNKTNGQVLYTISMDEKNALEAAGFVCEEAEFVVY